MLKDQREFGLTVSPRNCAHIKQPGMKEESKTAAWNQELLQFERYLHTRMTTRSLERGQNRPLMSVPAHSAMKTKKKSGQLVGGDGLGSEGQTVRSGKFIAVNLHIAVCLPKYWANSWVSVCPILGTWVPCPMNIALYEDSLGK